MSKAISTKTILGDIADILPGVSLQGKGIKTGASQELGVLNIRNIDLGSLQLSNLETLSVPSVLKFERYAVKPGDVLLTMRGSKIKSAVVPQGVEGKLIISKNLAAIRIRDNQNITPDALQIYLDSAEGQQALFLASRTVTGLIALSVKDLASIQITIPSLQIQKRLYEIVKAFREFDKANREAMEIREKVTNQLIDLSFQ